MTNPRDDDPRNRRVPEGVWIASIVGAVLVLAAMYGVVMFDRHGTGAPTAAAPPATSTPATTGQRP